MKLRTQTAVTIFSVLVAFGSLGFTLGNLNDTSTVTCKTLRGLVITATQPTVAPPHASPELHNLIHNSNARAKEFRRRAIQQLQCS